MVYSTELCNQRNQIISLTTLIFTGFLSLFLIAGWGIYRRRGRKKRWLDQIIERYQKNELVPAKRDLSEYLRRYPHSLEGWLLKGNLSLQLNETANAQMAFAQALKLNPSDERALLGLGIVARRNYQYDLAEDYYYRVLKANPTSYSAKSNLLILEILNGNPDTAVSLGEDAWRVADKSKPEQLSIGANLAIAYYENGQIEQCRQVIQQLEALDYRGVKYLHQYLEGEITLSDIL